MGLLDDVAQSDLTACSTVAEMAQAEGFTPDTYALVLAEHIRTSTVPLDVQRERLASLSTVGARADQASAEELARHAAVLEALFHRFARMSVELASEGPRMSVAAERYLNAAIKAQRAAMAALSALKVLRDSQPLPCPDNATTSPSGEDDGT